MIRVLVNQISTRGQSRSLLSLAIALVLFVHEERDHQALLANEREHERHNHVEMSGVLESGLARILHKFE